MKNLILSSQSNPAIIATAPNIANVTTPIMTITVPEGAIYDFLNKTTVRNSIFPGIALIVVLNDSDGNRIRDGQLVIGSQAPADEFVTNHRAIPLTLWADLSAADQRNENYRATLATGGDLNIGDVLILKRGYKLVFQLNSPETVDMSKSYIEIPAMEENK